MKSNKLIYFSWLMLASLVTFILVCGCTVSGNSQAVYGWQNIIEPGQDPDTANLMITYPSGHSNLTGRNHYVSWETAASLIGGYITSWTDGGNYIFPKDNDSVNIPSHLASGTGVLNLIGRIDQRYPTSSDVGVAIGKETLLNIIDGLNNVAVGGLSLRNTEYGSNNTAIGIQSLGDNIDGSNNTTLGYFAGHSVLGDGNVMIGYLAGTSYTGSNKLYIDNSSTSSPLIYGDFANDTVKINGALILNGTDGGLAATIEMLKEGVIQFDSDDGNTDQNFIRFKPLQDGSRNVDFLMSTTTTPFSGSRNDNVFYWGWNLGAGGGAIESGKGALGISMEDFYNPSGTNAYGEFHLIHIDTLGNSRRPMTFQLDNGNTSTWSMALSLADIKYTLPTDITKIGFDFTMPSGNLALLKLLNPQTGLGVEMLANDASNEFQISNTMGSGATLLLNSFEYTYAKQLGRSTSFGDAATTIAGNDGSGWFTNVGIGYGLNLTSGTLLVDSSKLATQYDLTTIGGSTPGIDDVLAVGQDITNNRTIQTGGYNLNIVESAVNQVQVGSNEIKIIDPDGNGNGNILRLGDDGIQYYDNTAHNGSFIINGTAPDGSEALKVVGDAVISGTINGVKKYVALLTQSGTDPPVATVLENSLGGTVSYSYTSFGTYEATATGLLVSGKTIIRISSTLMDIGGSDGALSARIEPITFPNSFAIKTISVGNGDENELLNQTPIEIIVYP